MKKQIKQALTVLTVYVVNALSVISAKAVITTDNDRPPDLMGGDFRSGAISVINYILSFLGLITVAFIIYAGFLMVTAGGEGDGIDKGKKIITGAAIGIVIILMSYLIVNVIVGVGGTAT